jgi:hypothetical protein
MRLSAWSRILLESLTIAQKNTTKPEAPCNIHKVLITVFKAPSWRTTPCWRSRLFIQYSTPSLSVGWSSTPLFPYPSSACFIRRFFDHLAFINMTHRACSRGLTIYSQLLNLVAVTSIRKLKMRHTVKPRNALNMGVYPYVSLNYTVSKNDSNLLLQNLKIYYNSH